MIQSGSVFLFGLNFIEIFDPTVNTIVNRLAEAFELSEYGARVPVDLVRSKLGFPVSAT